MNSSKHRNRLYNFIVNTYGLSKEMIMEHALGRIEDVLDKNIRAKLDSGRLEDLILKKVEHYMVNGFKTHYYGSSKEPLADVVRQIIREEVKKTLDEKYSVEIKAKV